MVQISTPWVTPTVRRFLSNYFDLLLLLLSHVHHLIGEGSGLFVKKALAHSELFSPGYNNHYYYI